MFDSYTFKTKIIMVLLFLLIPTTAIGCFLTYFGIGPAKTLADWGATGDFFGGVLNPLFSFVTILLLLFSLNMQLKELNLTREEMALTREEHRKSREAMEDQHRNSQMLLEEEKSNQILNQLELEDKKIESSLAWKYTEKLSIGDLPFRMFKSAFASESTQAINLQSKVYLLEIAFVSKIRLITILSAMSKDQFVGHLVRGTIDQLFYLIGIKSFFKLSDEKDDLITSLQALCNVLEENSGEVNEIKTFIEQLQDRLLD
ncbi:hypothetical protein [Pseudoalteromonas rhizosphaerae]|uniref:hypothetical protein n=1 Tax=Pseudoalteromonas rhizosphaerae TaxID=2518973 RepID=UPI00384B0A53